VKTPRQLKTRHIVILYGSIGLTMLVSQQLVFFWLVLPKVVSRLSHDPVILDWVEKLLVSANRQILIWVALTVLSLTLAWQRSASLDRALDASEKT
jgi:hypothetical protein